MSTTAAIAAASMLILAIAGSSFGAPRNVEATMIANSLETFAIRNTPTNIQLVGTANYPTYHYEIVAQPSSGSAVLKDSAKGIVTFTPPADTDGIVLTFSYKIVSNYNPAWFSNVATVKVAVVKQWTAYYPAVTTPVQIANFIRDRQLTAATATEEPGVTNIEPYKATSEGSVHYSNVKAAWIMTGQDWYKLTLGQRQYLMDELPFKTGLWIGAYS